MRAHLLVALSPLLLLGCEDKPAPASTLAFTEWNQTSDRTIELIPRLSDVLSQGTVAAGTLRADLVQKPPETSPLNFEDVASLGCARAIDAHSSSEQRPRPRMRSSRRGT